MGDAVIRAAKPEEGATLSDLALRSKSFWGYDAHFVQDCRAELTISAHYISANPVYVCEASARVVGFYSLVAKDAGVVDLDLLYVEPTEIGRGRGRELFRHAVEEARRRGFRLMTIEADPHAEDFYRAMGARRVGQIASPVRAGRALPLLHYHLIIS